MSTKLLKVPEAAARLNLGRSHTYALLERGALPSIRIGRALRIPEAALEDFIRRNTRYPAGAGRADLG